MIRLVTPRLILATPSLATASAAHQFHLRNLAHLAPWSPPIPAAAHTTGYWQTVAQHAIDSLAAGSLVRWWVFPTEQPDLMLASIGFSQIHRGPFCNGVLGYQIDHAHEGRGLMYEALHAACEYMFSEQRLHRISANYRPENVRSGRLLARLGFRIEGYAERYLFIDGDWRDHILTSRTNPQFRDEWNPRR